MTSPAFDVDAVLLDPATKVLLCCGSGGVGKTTTAAALAIRAAEAGRKVVVLTIDPARRLAQSLGLGELDNTPRPVKGLVGSGSLDAMMLDMKRTFDDIVLAHTTKDKAEQIFGNPFYQALSSSFAGTQEYMAMEKLSQLQAQGSWELVIVDTPPTRSALDFLDAPQNLSRFLDGRLLKLLLMPAKAGGRAYLKVVTGSLSLFSKAFTRILGVQLLEDVSQFVSALETMFGGFRERAQQTYELLAAKGTAFVVVAAPEAAAIREASYFVDRLSEEKMPLAGLVLNRVHTAPGGTLTGERALSGAETLEAVDGPDEALTAGLLRLHAERIALAARDARMRQRFVRSHPTVPVAQVVARPGDVHDLAQLRAVGEELAGA